MRKSGCEEQNSGGVNGEQRDSSPSSQQPGKGKKDMIWHMLKFRTREGCEDKPQLVLLVEHFKAESECNL